MLRHLKRCILCKWKNFATNFATLRVFYCDIMILEIFTQRGNKKTFVNCSS